MPDKDAEDFKKKVLERKKKRKEIDDNSEIRRKGAPGHDAGEMFEIKTPEEESE